MSYQYLEVKPLRSAADALAEFVLELSHWGSAKLTSGRPAVVSLRQPLAQEELAVLLAELGKRSHHWAHEAVLMTFSGPPPYEHSQNSSAWPHEQLLDWAEDSVVWLEKGARKSVMLAAALFQDDYAVEVRSLFLPVRADGRLGWTQVQWEMHSGVGVKFPGPSARAESGTRLLDAYHHDVGQPHGLDRGGNGSNRNHQWPQHADQPAAGESTSQQVTAVEIEEHGPLAQENEKLSAQIGKLREEKQLLEFALRRCHFMLSKDLALQLDAWAGNHLKLSLRGQRVVNANLFGQAAARGQLELVQALLNLGIKVDIVGTDAVTALMRAAAVSNKDVIATLVDAGADVTRQDVNGQNCADYARAAGHIELAEELDRMIEIACEEEYSSEPS